MLYSVLTHEISAEPYGFGFVSVGMDRVVL